MYYELYIDLLFLVNFMMDSFVLFFVGRVLQCRASCRRIFLGAAVGAGGTCLVAVTPLPGVVKMLLLHLAVNSAMIKVGLKVRGRKAFFKAFGFLYAASFLFGGILQAFRPYLRSGSLFFMEAAVSYVLLDWCWRAWSKQRRLQQECCKVTIWIQGRSVSLTALLDTGNTLTDPYSGEPVSIVVQRTLREVTEMQQEGSSPGSGLHYIPYRAVGKEGVLPVIRAEKMCIFLQEECWVERPVLALCEENISEKNEYEMILNPDITGGRKK